MDGRAGVSDLMTGWGPRVSADADVEWTRGKRGVVGYFFPILFFCFRFSLEERRKNK